MSLSLFGYSKEDPIQGEMIVYPVGEDGRWGQILIKNKSEVWIIAHSVNDAKAALKKRRMAPKSLYVSTTGNRVMRVWGMPKLQNFRTIFALFSRANLEQLSMWVASPSQLLGCLPAGLEDVIVTVVPCYSHDCNEWNEFFDYMFCQPLRCLDISHVYRDKNIVHDGCLISLCCGPRIIPKFKELRLMDGLLSLAEAKEFRCCLVLPETRFLFDRIIISEIRSISDLSDLMDQDVFINVRLKASTDLRYSEDECNRALTSRWSVIEATEETTNLYLNILEHSTNLDATAYELPQCRSDETVEYLKRIVNEVIDQFIVLLGDNKEVSVNMKIQVSKIKDFIKEKGQTEMLNLEWSKDAVFSHVDTAKITLRPNTQDNF